MDLHDYKIISTDSKAPKGMKNVYFYQLKIGDIFLWQGNEYIKTDEEEA